MAQHVDRLPHRRQQLEVARLQRELTRPQPRRVEQVVDQVQQQGPGVARLLQLALQLGGIRAFLGEQRQLQHAEQAVERRAHLVRHAGKEVVLLLVGALQLAHLPLLLLDAPPRNHVLADADGADRPAVLVELRLSGHLQQHLPAVHLGLDHHLEALDTLPVDSPLQRTERDLERVDVFGGRAASEAADGGALDEVGRYRGQLRDLLVPGRDDEVAVHGKDGRVGRVDEVGQLAVLGLQLVRLLVQLALHNLVLLRQLPPVHQVDHHVGKHDELFSLRVVEGRPRLAVDETEGPDGLAVADEGPARVVADPRVASDQRVVAKPLVLGGVVDLEDGGRAGHDGVGAKRSVAAGLPHWEPFGRLEPLPVRVHERDERNRHVEVARRKRGEPIERLLKVGVEQMKVVQRGNSLLVVWVTGPLIRLVSALLFALLVTRAGGMSEAEIRGTHASYALAAECREGDVAAEVCRVWKAAAHGSAI
mmetsp:Transcript_5932/g.18239  ORF Transcript_5932/g.18239 Transcript_5932/m.18239 type:complete len:478 (-) Transcript_5932:22-1455(-)